MQAIFFFAQHPQFPLEITACRYIPTSGTIQSPKELFIRLLPKNTKKIPSDRSNKGRKLEGQE